MDDILGVSGVERFRDLYGEWQQLVCGKRPSQDALAQGLAFQQFHHDETLAILLSDS